MLTSLAVSITALGTFGIVLVTGPRMGPVLWAITHGRGVHLADLAVIAVAYRGAIAWIRWIQRESVEW